MTAYYTASVNICARAADILWGLPEVGSPKECKQFGSDLSLAMAETGRVNLKAAADRTCEKWSSEMDKKFFGGSEGAFLSVCPFYGEEITNQELIQMLHKGEEDLASIDLIYQAVTRLETAAW